MKVFLEVLEVLFWYVNENRYRLVLAGDFNVNLLENTKHQCNIFVILNSYGFTNLIKEATHVTTKGALLIVSFITNFESENTCSGVIAVHLSDHLPIFTVVLAGTNKHRATSPTLLFNALHLPVFKTFIRFFRMQTGITL